MLLTQKQYKEIIEKTLDNDTPSRLAEYLGNGFIEYGKSNKKYWSYIIDEVINIYPKVITDEYYTLNDILEFDKIFDTKHEKYIFIYSYANRKIIENIERLHYTKRNFSIDQLSMLMNWIKKCPVEKNKRYLFLQPQIKVYTKRIFNIVFDQYLLQPDELLKTNIESLSAFINLYFSVRILYNENSPSKDELFIDKSDKSQFYIYKPASLKRNDNQDFNKIYTQRYNTIKTKFEVGNNFRLTEYNFKTLETSHWKLIRKRFKKSDPEYQIITRYVGLLPKFKSNEHSKFNFGIARENHNGLLRIISKINKLVHVTFLDKTKSTPKDLADLLTVEDFTLPDIKPIYFQCEAILVVAILNLIYSKFSSDPATKFAPRIDKSGKFHVPNKKKPSNYSQNDYSSFTYRPLRRVNTISHLTEWKNETNIIQKDTRLDNVFKLAQRIILE